MAESKDRDKQEGNQYHRCDCFGPEGWFGDRLHRHVHGSVSRAPTGAASQPISRISVGVFPTWSSRSPASTTRIFTQELLSRLLVACGLRSRIKTADGCFQHMAVTLTCWKNKPREELLICPRKVRKLDGWIFFLVVAEAPLVLE